MNKEKQVALTRLGDLASGRTALVALGSLGAGSVFAQSTSTDPFETVLATATDKVGDYALALVGLAGVAVVFMIATKYVKRIPKAS